MFLRQIEKSVPEDLDVHLIVDNYCTHKHAKVRAWLAQRPRFHVHYTPRADLKSATSALAGAPSMS
jgi:putative transposase